MKTLKGADQAKDGWNSPDYRVPQNLSQSLRREEAQNQIYVKYNISLRIRFQMKKTCRYLT